MIFKKGFAHKGFKFGWHNKTLYRLPITKDGKDYPLKELSLIEIGNKQGFRLIRDKKSLDQVRNMTKNIKVVVKVIKCDECL